MKAGRDAAGSGIALRIDTNCPWTVREAIAIRQTPGVGGDPDLKLLAKLRVA